MKKYLLGIALLFSLGSLSGCQKYEEEVPILLEPVGVEIDTAIAEYGNIYTMTVYEGEVLPYVEEVSFEVDGKLKEFKVSVGDTVEAGQLLAKLDDAALQEKIQMLEEEIKDIQIMGSFSDRKKAADIEIAVERLEMLESRRGSDEDKKAQQLEIELLNLELQETVELRDLELGRLNKQLQALKGEAAGMSLKAPISGNVVYIDEINVGDSVKGLETVMCIADESRLSITSEYIAPAFFKNAYKDLSS